MDIGRSSFPGPFDLVTTRDGSRTLRAAHIGDHYRSVHGAATESRHVFIEAGLKQVRRSPIDLLEVGLGTGLNALLTMVECDRSASPVRYHAIEPFPLPWDLLRTLDHVGMLRRPDLSYRYERMMNATVPVRLGACMHFTPHHLPLNDFAANAAFDLVYMDAFAPEKQPEPWTDDAFQRLYRALRPGGTLVTYCAKGEVRRTMLRAGFTVERLKGPWGKREMFRATRPSP